MLALATRVAAAVRTAAPDVLKRVSARIGSSPKVDSILNTVKNNIPLLAYAGFELFGGADSDVRQILEHPDAIAVRDALIRNVDYASTVSDSDITSYDDEFALIEEASLMLGGRDKLIMLRNALALPSEIYRKQAEIVAMGYRR